MGTFHPLSLYLQVSETKIKSSPRMSEELDEAKKSEKSQLKLFIIFG